MTGSYFYNDESLNFDFYTNLSIVDKLEFVNSVTDTLVDGENYNSIIRDLIFDYMIIKIFTDIDMSVIEDGDSSISIGDIEDFLEETNIVDVVKANVELGLIDELSDAIDKNIEYRTGIHKNPLGDALASLVNTLEKKLDGIDLDSMAEMASMLTGMTSDLTPESIVKAYTSTDVFKNNMKEIEESKERRAKIADDVSKMADFPTKESE